MTDGSCYHSSIMETSTSLPLINDHCRQAVQSRDTASDTAFCYAARSTGIYCRPSCPSRRPGRDQVCFFETPDAAEEAGFRACLRCRPREAAAQAEAVAKACRYMESHLEDVCLAALGMLTGLSLQHFQRVFRRLAGVSPREYVAACRLRQFKNDLKNGEIE